MSEPVLTSFFTNASRHNFVKGPSPAFNMCRGEVLLPITLAKPN